MFRLRRICLLWQLFPFSHRFRFMLRLGRMHGFGAGFVLVRKHCFMLRPVLPPLAPPPLPWGFTLRSLRRLMTGFMLRLVFWPMLLFVLGFVFGMRLLLMPRMLPRSSSL
jgi:hypothetical protein